MISKYEELDMKILHILSVNPTPIFNIWLKFRDDVRDITVIDRRMQVLKKKGFVRNVRGCGWVKL